MAALKVSLIALVVLAAAQGAIAGRQLHGVKTPPALSWDGPLLNGKWIGSLVAYFNRTTTDCTSPFDLLEDDADNFSTFATLVASLELTDIFTLPPVLGSCRALSEDFFAAWFAATKTTDLPDLTTYTEEKLTKLRTAVASLLVSNVKSLVSGPKLKKAIASMTDDLSLGDYTEFDVLESGDYIDSDVVVTVAGGDDYESWSGDEVDLGTYFDSAWNFWLPVSPNYICPNATLTTVSDIPKGAEGCELEDCLACAGIDGCYCDGCACVCDF